MELKPFKRLGIIMIKEWNMLRVLACLSIVFLHSTTYTGWTMGHLNIENYHFYRLLLCYATPTFIVLSIIILANRYSNNIPDGFFSKRFTLIVLPFISFAMIDALMINVVLSDNSNLVFKKFFLNLIGEFEGYFILIIFQFYIIHYLVVKYKVSIEKFLPVSIVIMMISLYLLFSDYTFFVEYRKFFEIIFISWLGYYTIGNLIGTHYNQLRNYLKTYKWYTVILLIFSVYLMYLSFEAGNTAVHSRRIDILVLSVSVTLFVLAWGQLLPNLKLINLISNYSLGIYLLHWQVQRVLAPYFADFFESMTSMILSLFIVSLILSMLIIKILSWLPFGKYIVGNARRKYQKNRPTQKANAA